MELPFHYFVQFSDYDKVHHVVDHMVERALSHDGTCTGEHGVGVGKRKYLPLELVSKQLTL